MDGLQILGWIVALVVTLWSFYWYLTATYDFWEKRGIKFVPPKLFIGTMIQFLGKHEFHELEMERYKKYGNLFGYFEGRKPALQIADPDLIKNVLVKDFPSFTSRRNLSIGDNISDNMVNVVQGEKWKRIRSIISPTFSTGKIKRVTSIFMDSADTVCKNFEAYAKRKEEINAKRLFGAYTMDVIASSAFGTKIDSHNDPDNRFVAEAKKVFGTRVPIRFILFFLLPQLFRMLRMSVFDKSAMTFFKEVTLKIIAERKRTGEVRNDFLQLLLDARSADENQKEIQNETEKSDLKRLSEDELIAQCVIFFIAGYDTTASTLSFASYLLATNPDCQEKVIKEVDAMLAANNGEMTYEGIQSLKYLDNVFTETLRLYPPAIRIERQSDEDYELGDTGLTIPKGMIVGVPVYSIHHDPKYYPDPEKFDPNRFTAEGKASRNQYVYLPFGAGPRNCVGMRFALMELKVCLAKVLSKFRLKKGSNTKVPATFTSKSGLLQPINILLAVEKRTDVP